VLYDVRRDLPPGAGTTEPGSPAPVEQGWFDDHFGLGCPVPVPSGPGKVVLHQ